MNPSAQHPGAPAEVQGSRAQCSGWGTGQSRGTREHAEEREDGHDGGEVQQHQEPPSLGGGEALQHGGVARRLHRPHPAPDQNQLPPQSVCRAPPRPVDGANTNDHPQAHMPTTWHACRGCSLTCTQPLPMNEMMNTPMAMPKKSLSWYAASAAAAHVQARDQGRSCRNTCGRARCTARHPAPSPGHGRTWRRIWSPTRVPTAFCNLLARCGGPEPGHQLPSAMITCRLQSLAVCNDQLHQQWLATNACRDAPSLCRHRSYGGSEHQDLLRSQSSASCACTRWSSDRGATHHELRGRGALTWQRRRRCCHAAVVGRKWIGLIARGSHCTMLVVVFWLTASAGTLPELKRHALWHSVLLDQGSPAVATA